MDKDIIREAVKGSCDELYRSVEVRMSRLALCVWMGEELLHGGGVMLKREGDDVEAVGL
jgi:hypothetical protein